MKCSESLCSKISHRILWNITMEYLYSHIITGQTENPIRHENYLDFESSGSAKPLGFPERFGKICRLGVPPFSATNAERICHPGLFCWITRS